MSNRNDDRRPGHSFPSRDERLRERVLQQFVRKWELDNHAEQTLRAIFGQCSFRFDAGGKFSFQMPGSITVNQQIRIAMPLRGLAKDYRERAIGQLERIANIGKRVGMMVRGSLANPLVFLAGKSPFDGYLTVCRNSGIHWGILRALQHLRDVITVTEEHFFTDPSRVAMNWRLHWDRITPTMLHQVEKCLRPVDAAALHTPACNRWIAGIQRFFEQVKDGTFRIGTSEAGQVAPVRPGAPAQPVGSLPPEQTLSSPTAEGLPGWQDGLEKLRQYLLPHYLDLSPEDFATLCRGDGEAADFARRLGGALERFAARCLRAVRRKFLEDCAAPLPTSGDGVAEMGRCLRQLTKDAVSFRDWLEGELPQGDNTVGRRLLELAENSLVGGLFLLYLQQRHGELFRKFPESEHTNAARRSEANRAAAVQTSIIQAIESAVQRQRLVLDSDVEKGEASAEIAHPLAGQVARICQNATATLFRLVRAAGTLSQPLSDGQREVQQSAVAAGKLAHRFLSAEAVAAGTEPGVADYMVLAAYEPGGFPATRCRYFHRGTETEAAYEPVELCRFSRRGGLAFSAEIAIPIETLFGPKSPLARMAEFLGAGAEGQLATWRQLAKNPGVRQCLPYLENHGAQAARIRIRGADSRGDVIAVALPSAAMAMSDDFTETISLDQAIERAAQQSPGSEAIFRAVDAYWRENGIASADYSICVLARRADEPGEAEAEEELKWRRRVRRFLNQKNRWPLEEAEQILKALGIVIESKSDGAPHGKVRFNERHHTLSSKLLKDGQVYARYLHEWIVTLGREPALAELLEHSDPRLAPYMRKSDAAEE